MKKVFMPSMDELYQMQDMSVNVYKYILVKAIESLICYGVNYPNIGILKYAYKYLQDDPDIARAVCLLYPNELIYSEIARTDVNLCYALLQKKESKSINLDYLSLFDDGTVESSFVMNEVLSLLTKELKENPKYRFEYKDCNFLNKVFNAEITDTDLACLYWKDREEKICSLIDIEPVYAIKLNDSYLEKNNRIELLQKGISSYAFKYIIPCNAGFEYYGKDILTNPDQNVKRLMKCIKDRTK